MSKKAVRDKPLTAFLLKHIHVNSMKLFVRPTEMIFYNEIDVMQSNNCGNVSNDSNTSSCAKKLTTRY